MSTTGATPHICLLGPIPPPWGGVQTHVVELRERIRAEGMRCSLVNLTRHRQDDADDMYFPRSSMEVMSLLRRLRPDIAHVHMGGSYFAKHAALFLYLSTLPGRSVFTFHSGGFPGSPEGQGASPRSLRGFALRQLDAVVGVNVALLDTFKRYGVSQERRHLIEPHSLRLDEQTVRATPLPSSIESFAARHDPLLVAVGLLEPEYGLEVQLKGFTKVREAFPRAGLLLIGSGSLHDSLSTSIAAHPFASDILLAGDVPRDATLASIARASLLLRTTHYDGDALSVREALALGTPVLATDNGMRPSGVRLLEKLEGEALASAIQALLVESPAERPRVEASQADPMARIIKLYRDLMAAEVDLARGRKGVMPAR